MSSSKIKLFLLPFAGGNRTAYRAYEPYLKPHFELHPLELAGHGGRMVEPLNNSLLAMRDDIIKQIEPHMDNHTILYGHSLGGLLAFLVTLYFEQERDISPKRLIISGRANPTMPPKQMRHHLPQSTFFQELKSLGGMPDAFFAYPELHELFEPILRADFKAIECFDFKDNQNRKIKSPICVLHGLNDSFSQQEALKWSDFTQENSIAFHPFKGGHFFIHAHTKEVCEIIQKSL